MARFATALFTVQVLPAGSDIELTPLVLPVFVARTVPITTKEPTGIVSALVYVRVALLAVFVPVKVRSGSKKAIPYSLITFHTSRMGGSLGSESETVTRLPGELLVSTQTSLTWGLEGAVLAVVTL